MTMTIYHLNIIANEIDRGQLNKLGWSGHPRFEQMADITTGAENQIEQATKAYINGDYKAVAIIGDEDLDLEDAFRLTNHIDQAWTKNEEVSTLGGMRQRSTSVGDIVELDGVLHLCANAGFQEIGNERALFEGEA